MALSEVQKDAGGSGLPGLSAGRVRGSASSIAAECEVQAPPNNPLPPLVLPVPKDFDSEGNSSPQHSLVSSQTELSPVHALPAGDRHLEGWMSDCDELQGGSVDHVPQDGQRVVKHDKVQQQHQQNQWQEDRQQTRKPSKHQHQEHKQRQHEQREEQQHLEENQEQQHHYGQREEKQEQRQRHEQPEEKQPQQQQQQVQLQRRSVVERNDQQEEKSEQEQQEEHSLEPEEKQELHQDQHQQKQQEQEQKEEQEEEHEQEQLQQQHQQQQRQQHQEQQQHHHQHQQQQQEEQQQSHQHKQQHQQHLWDNLHEKQFLLPEAACVEAERPPQVNEQKQAVRAEVVSHLPSLSQEVLNLGQELPVGAADMVGVGATEWVSDVNCRTAASMHQGRSLRTLLTQHKAPVSPKARQPSTRRSVMYTTIADTLLSILPHLKEVHLSEQLTLEPAPAASTAVPATTKLPPLQRRRTLSRAARVEPDPLWSPLAGEQRYTSSAAVTASKMRAALQRNTHQRRFVRAFQRTRDDSIGIAPSGRRLVGAS